MVKFRWYYDKDKEEKFLNTMSAKGYAMKKFFLGFYLFEKTNSKEYTYRVDLINDKSATELKEYIALIEESGAEFVQKWGIWAFFRKKGKFELYSDIESQISLYKRIRSTFIALTLVELSCFPIIFINLNTGYKKIFVFILSAIILIFLYQIFNCTKKIKNIEKI